MPDLPHLLVVIAAGWPRNWVPGPGLRHGVVNSLRASVGPLVALLFPAWVPRFIAPGAGH